LVEVELKAGSTARFKGKMISGNTPWVAVIIPDNDISLKKEVVGRLTKPD